MTAIFRKRVRTLFPLLIILALLPACVLWAQKGESNNRTVNGQVVDKSGNPIPKAVVYLKNTKTLQIQTRIADDSGSFHFNGLNPNIDYELHAEYQGASSPVKTISSFDSRKNVSVSLKIDKK